MVEVILSNLKMLWLCLSPKMKHSPNFVSLQMQHDLSNIELVLLAHLITITPGTMTVDLEEGNKLQVHILDDTPEEVENLKSIARRLENCIFKIFRGSDGTHELV
jgi:multicomponent Na+:H+ antiporter subunit E